MKDFFRVMGKAFAVVFGSTLALALVLVLAMRPVLRSWSQAREAPALPAASLSHGPPPGATTVCNAYDVIGRCVEYKEKATTSPDTRKTTSGKITNLQPMAPPPGFVGLTLFVDNCDKDGCSVYDSLHQLVGFITRDEINRANWVPAGEHRK